ncbi:MAG: saccharopine dehydrogenase [Flavobacteriales bacterium]|nr:saccharopine dehydrogenase [Flavobacteriales bacterium]
MTNKPHVWLRAETKPMERRVALTPECAKQMVDAGYKVTVEDSSQGAIPISAYANTGCDIKEAHSWKDADKDVIVFGLKELEEESWPLIHRHIHFAHVYKEQEGWKSQLDRFVKGQGELYDLEYLVHENGRRVAAFGFWAGFVGAAVAIKAWGRKQQKLSPVLAELGAFNSKQEMIADVLASIPADAKPKVMIMGAKGRSGQGAVEMAESIGAELVKWDMEETAKGGPFKEILEADVFVNCVFVQAMLPPFLTKEMLLEGGRKLSVISDVSCDPFSDFNPLPIYDQITDFANPVLRLVNGENPLDLIAIDHLPSMLPVESSEDFCNQLLPHLLQLDNLNEGVWQRANKIFKEKTEQL